MSESTMGQVKTDDLISRQAAMDALWKALYEYEGKTEKQFQESEDLDVRDWMAHRIFVQNMNDIDRHTILNLPPIEPKRGKWIRNDNGTYSCSVCHSWIPEEQHHYARFCLYCGSDMRGEEE